MDAPYALIDAPFFWLGSSMWYCRYSVNPARIFRAPIMRTNAPDCESR